MIVVGTEVVDSWPTLVREGCEMWRLKFRKPVGDFGEGMMFDAIVEMLSQRNSGCGEPGVVGAVHQLLCLEVLALEELDDEPLVLVLNCRILLNALVLDIGGLEASESGACASRVSGAAYSYASDGFAFLPC